MIVDLVHTTTRDGVRLDGIFQESSESDARSTLDVACFIHGTGGNFYSSTLFEQLTPRFLGMGCSVLRVNTRGHDGISTAVTSRGGMRQGAAFEIVDDCRHDLVAWIDWLQELGCKKIALVGHSMGAIKAIYTVALEENLPVTCVAAISPPLLSYSLFAESSASENFLNSYNLADQENQSGNPGALLQVNMPLPLVITAGGYIDKYGPDEKYNLLNFIARVKVPLLVTIGGQEAESNVAFHSTVQALKQLSPKPRKMTVELIPGADHFYSEKRTELGNVVQQWIQDSV